jgi:tetratricopeptide (TPR) repeat protein
MKTLNYIKTTVIAAMLLTGLFSCKKSFLEVEPKGKVIASKTSEYDLLLNNIDLFNYAANAQVPMGDEIAALDPFFTADGLKTQRLFRWEDDIYDNDVDAGETLAPMKNIYLFAKIINEIMDSEGGSEAAKKSIRAEAMGSRGWTYFLLINYYGKPYNAATAATDPGFPIITKADITATDFPRASVQAVYDFIISDLTAAIAELPAGGVTHRLRMSKTAAQGILAKVYMFMGKYDLALPLLNEAISSLPASKVVTQLYNYKVRFVPGGDLMPTGNISYPTAPNVEENVFVKQFSNQYVSTSNVLLLKPETVALFSAQDLRRNWYLNTPQSGTTPLPNGMLRKRGLTVSYFGLTVPDLYLLRAETKVRLSDLGGAKTDVETLRNARLSSSYEVPAVTAGDKMLLLQFILEERIREFALQGYRWFDMRRLSVDPLFVTPTYTHRLYAADGSVTATYTLRPERFTLRIPKKIIAQNTGMNDNP